ncbi:MAG: hypothetical protein MJ072_01895, partial [Clostridia bacterium]|nr:hypothetical protein [Clostridia bacterium]
ISGKKELIMDKKIAITIREYGDRKRAMRCAADAGFRCVNVAFGEAVDLLSSDDWESEAE